MRPWVAALISVGSIAVALFGTMGLLYYVYLKRRGCVSRLALLVCALR